MSEKATYKNFVELCQVLGENVAYFQGGGGNTSVKLENSRMVIKGSGLRLKDIQNADGYADVDYKAITNYMLNIDLAEDVFNAKVMATNVIQKHRPSMETGFHAVLGNYVVHSHSVYVNVLNCSYEGLNP